MPAERLEAAIRLADGRLCLVADVPSEACLGQVLTCRLGGEDLRGPLAIAPALLAWADPAVPRAAFVAVMDDPPPPAAADGPFLAQLGAGAGGPPLRDLDGMIRRAWRERPALGHD
jgi:hypothetical protein